ncbi:hypothetical protein IMG5_181130 [Ichthyophthirius multifiliis]|uniref:Septin-type G domain-containing protein n=1 Tax=Ichthyophthirius multifiliis TaxID=5932 RepID=G0R2X3_ICHMU|nr:hypothetical protein IMG5_181130 [Ichthyophthirius multifiliis]EGR28184.1 hypothetical protein IMG5_181130 [Ichthyophthirius multifiliis]|eukprot:XP_004027529.1 hypothetical protein IMG5_181130 [Ichthyophthirius multifiliis]
MRQQQRNQNIIEETVVSEYVSQGSQSSCLNQPSQKAQDFILEKLLNIEIKKQEYLNIIVVGAQRTGKSTFIDSFLMKNFEKQCEFEKINNIVEKRAVSNGKKILNLNLIDTPGYIIGEGVENFKKWYINIKNFIVEKVFFLYIVIFLYFILFQFEHHQEYLEKLYRTKESIQNLNEQDERIHVCLFFLSLDCIKQTDLYIIKKLQKYVNIIPVISRGDLYQYSELKQIKQELQKKLYNNKYNGLILMLYQRIIQHLLTFQTDIQEDVHLFQLYLVKDNIIGEYVIMKIQNIQILYYQKSYQQEI